MTPGCCNVRARCSLAGFVHSGILCPHYRCHPEDPIEHGGAEGLLTHHCGQHFLRDASCSLFAAWDTSTEKPEQNLLLF